MVCKLYQIKAEELRERVRNSMVKVIFHFHVWLTRKRRPNFPSLVNNVTIERDQRDDSDEARQYCI